MHRHPRNLEGAISVPSIGEIGQGSRRIGFLFFLFNEVFRGPASNYMGEIKREDLVLIVAAIVIQSPTIKTANVDGSFTSGTCILRSDNASNAKDQMFGWVILVGME